MKYFSDQRAPGGGRLWRPTMPNERERVDIDEDEKRQEVKSSFGESREHPRRSSAEL